MLRIKEWKYNDMFSKVCKYGDIWQNFDYFRRTDDIETKIIITEDGYAEYEGRYEIVKETEKAYQISFAHSWTEWIPKSAIVIA